MKTITRLEPGHTAMIEYALKVADAIGIRYGMVHGEYMLDENGPVLIDVPHQNMKGEVTGTKVR